MDNHVLDLINRILCQDIQQGLNAVVVANIVEKNHCDDGYFSWDGILDDLADIVGFENASQIVGNC
jgi:hypothetical protein